MEATKRPWRNDEYGAIAGADGHCIALAANDQGKQAENAAFIVLRSPTSQSAGVPKTYTLSRQYFPL